MATEIYIGVNGIARRVKSVYYGVNGLARRVKRGYIGVNGLARQFMVFFNARFWSVVAGNEGTTIDYVFTGVQDGEWRLYMKSTCQTNTDTGRAFARVRLHEYDFTKASTLTMSYTASGTGESHSDIMLTYMDTSGGVIKQRHIPDGENISVSDAIPGETKYVDFCLQDGRAGQTEMELIIHSLSIGDVRFL